MPIPFITQLLFNGWPSHLPDPWLVLKVGSTLGTLAVTKIYCNGATNKSERNMHGKFIIMTGATSGVGAATAEALAMRGAQLLLLTHQPPSDPFVEMFIDDLRQRTNNQMIYAEHVDLSSFHSIRKFATKWIDNAPPRRLDMVILCAATLTPPGQPREETPEGIERTWMVNYLANFHLLGILSPAIRAQPFDRDVRIVLTTCSSYISAPALREDAVRPKKWSPGQAYARSKLALMTFGRSFQKHLDAYERPDKLPMQAKVVFVDPGLTRTTGTNRWLTRGSLLGLFFYVLCYPLIWLFLKSPAMGAQSFLHATMEGVILREPGGKLIKECIEVDVARKDIQDEAVAKELWEATDALIEKAEKAEAWRRAKDKKAKEEAEQVEEIESLVSTIKKGREREKGKGKGGDTAQKAKAKKKPI